MQKELLEGLFKEFQERLETVQYLSQLCLELGNKIKAGIDEIEYIPYPTNRKQEVHLYNPIAAKTPGYVAPILQEVQNPEPVPELYDPDKPIPKDGPLIVQAAPSDPISKKEFDDERLYNHLMKMPQKQQKPSINRDVSQFRENKAQDNITKSRQARLKIAQARAKI